MTNNSQFDSVSISYTPKAPLLSHQTVRINLSHSEANEIKLHYVLPAISNLSISGIGIGANANFCAQNLLPNCNTEFLISKQVSVKRLLLQSTNQLCDVTEYEQ